MVSRLQKFLCKHGGDQKHAAAIARKARSIRPFSPTLRTRGDQLHRHLYRWRSVRRLAGLLRGPGELAPPARRTGDTLDHVVVAMARSSSQFSVQLACFVVSTTT